VARKFRAGQSGLDWRDITDTVNTSFYDAQAQFGPGGLFAGWRHATLDELVQYWVNSGGAWDPVTGKSTVAESWVNDLLDLWGYTDLVAGGSRRAYVFVSDCGELAGAPHCDWRQTPWLSEALQSAGQDALAFAPYGEFAAGNPHPYLGHALVRSSVECVDTNNGICQPTSVPEPSSLAMVALGVLAMGRILRSRKSLRA
jgi:hypothetical protein